MRPFVDRVELIDAVQFGLLALRRTALARWRLTEAGIVRVHVHLARKLVELPRSPGDEFDVGR